MSAVKMTWDDFWEVCQKQCSRMDYDFATEHWDRGLSPKETVNIFNRQSAKKQHPSRRRVEDEYEDFE